MNWKRSDIPQKLVLEIYSRQAAGRDAVDEILMAETGAPFKVVWSAMERELDRGHIEFGVNLRYGWLTQEGAARLAELQTA